MLALIYFHSLSFLSFFPRPCKFKVCNSQPKAPLIPLTSGKERMVRVLGLSGLCSWSYRASTQGVAPGKRKHDFAKFSFPSSQCSQYWSMPIHSPPTLTPLLSYPLNFPLLHLYPAFYLSNSLSMSVRRTPHHLFTIEPTLFEFHFHANLFSKMRRFSSGPMN